MVLSKNKVELRGGAGGDYSSDSLLHNQVKLSVFMVRDQKTSPRTKQEASTPEPESALVMTEETSKSRNQTSVGGKRNQTPLPHTTWKNQFQGDYRLLRREKQELHI